MLGGDVTHSHVSLSVYSSAGSVCMLVASMPGGDVTRDHVSLSVSSSAGGVCMLAASMVTTCMRLPSSIASDESVLMFCMADCS